MPRYALIGFPLGHSFSKAYFTEKFARLGLHNYSYELIETPPPLDLRRVFEQYGLDGCNITIPHKIAALGQVDKLCESAKAVGAINVVKSENGLLTGYNTDVEGFRSALPKEGIWRKKPALILGTGGGAKAVRAALNQEGIVSFTVSGSGKGDFSYDTLPDLAEFGLIVNATPLGTYPNTQTAPQLCYQQIGTENYLFDLVYNPPHTLFLRLGAAAPGQNGMAMLIAQAEAAWAIWQKGI